MCSVLSKSTWLARYLINFRKGIYSVLVLGNSESTVVIGTKLIQSCQALKPCRFICDIFQISLHPKLFRKYEAQQNFYSSRASFVCGFAVQLNQLNNTPKTQKFMFARSIDQAERSASIFACGRS